MKPEQLTTLSVSGLLLSLSGLLLGIFGAFAFGLTLYYNSQTLKGITALAGIAYSQVGDTVTLVNTQIVQAGSGIGVSISGPITTVSNPRTVIASPELLPTTVVGNITTVHATPLIERANLTVGGDVTGPAIQMSLFVPGPYTFNVDYSSSTFTSSGLGLGPGLPPGGMGNYTIPDNGIFTYTFSSYIISSGLNYFSLRSYMAFNCADPTNPFSCSKAAAATYNRVPYVSFSGAGVFSLASFTQTIRVCPTCIFNVGDVLTIYYAFTLSTDVAVGAYGVNVAITQIA